MMIKFINKNINDEFNNITRHHNNNKIYRKIHFLISIIINTNASTNTSHIINIKPFNNRTNNYNNNPHQHEHKSIRNNKAIIIIT